MQVNGPGMVFLFSFDKKGHRGLKYDDASALRMHVAEAFSERISNSTHFSIIPLLLAEGWQRMAASERCWQWSRVEYQDHPMHNLISSESDSISQ